MEQHCISPRRVSKPFRTPVVVRRTTRHRRPSYRSSPRRFCTYTVKQSRSRPRTHGTVFRKLFILSGHPSPQSSFSSYASSSGNVTSGRNTPWAQNSSASQSPVGSAHQNAGQPRIQVSSLLSGIHSWSYILEVVQHPLRTAEFGSASLSRLPLAPPVVVQLIVRDQAGNSIVPEMELPFLIAHLSLFSGDGATPLDMSPPPEGGSVPRRLLYGNLVSSPHRLRDLQGRQGLYFLFPDVSIRWRGRFQLGITLLRLSRIDPSGAISIADHGTVLAQARTRTFDVLSHDQYSAPPQTRLTQSFIRQGVRMYTSAVNQMAPH